MHALQWIVGLLAPDRILTWVTGLNWVKIVSGVIPSILGVLVVWWRGGFHSIVRRFRRNASLRKYRNYLLSDVSSLPIIGRKEGFDLNKVYVPIDIARSDLMGKSAATLYSAPKVFVLVGGPGAGKSTYVKKALLDNLKLTTNHMCFFFRLRDYEKGASIEDLIVRRLESLGLGNARELVRTELQKTGSLTVLDGLDEVRPHIVNDAYEAIASFHSSFFDSQYSGRLIVTCRKEAYRSIPLAIPEIWEAQPLKDKQIQNFAKNWPLDYPKGRSPDEFWSDLSASEKILEVSRSPLLLVGSLLLYTETGLGIPGQRVKYLDKIKRTLIEDWATAQGQPPDPLRDAYTPVLTQTALKMHTRQAAELPRSDFIELLNEILPNVGFDSGYAEQFLDSLIKRTGILVRDLPNHIIFVHFTLQEFFASLQLTATFEPNEVAELEPKTWWREAILFTVAQVPDPTRLVEALFKTAPTIGVFAVAESPTPSLKVQETATIISLENLDSGNKEAIPALVALLRKISGRLADDLGYSLEKRLEGSNGEGAANVSQILASAGTELATGILSKHPDTWRYILENGGSISNNFEKKLIGWVAISDHPNWMSAAELLTNRPSFYGSLLTILNQLPSEKANYLASLIVEKLYKVEVQFGYRINPAEFSNDSEVSGYINYLSKSLQYVTNPDELLEKLSSENDFRRPYARGPGLVKTAVALRQGIKNNGSDVGKQISTDITNVLIWSRQGRSFILLIASCVTILGFLGTYPDMFGVYNSVIVGGIVLLGSEIAGRMRPPWSEYRRFDIEPLEVLKLGLIMLVGFAFCLSLSGGLRPLFEFSLYNFVWVLVCASLIAILACIPNQDFFDPLPPGLRRNKIVSTLFVVIAIWIGGLVSLAMWIVFRNNLLNRSIIEIFAAAVACYPLYCLFRIRISWKKVTLGAKRATTVKSVGSGHGSLLDSS